MSHVHTYSELTLKPVIEVELFEDTLSSPFPPDVLKDPYAQHAVIAYRCQHWENNQQCSEIEPRFYGPREAMEQKFAAMQKDATDSEASTRGRAHTGLTKASKDVQSLQEKEKQ